MFLDFLLSQHIITELQYNQVLAEIDSQYEGNFNKALFAAGVAEDALTAAKSTFYKLPYQKIDAKNIPHDILKYVAEDAAIHYKFVPIGFAEGVLSIGVTEPENIEGMNALQFISAKQGIPFKIFLISYSDFIAVLESYKALSQEVDSAVGNSMMSLKVRISHWARGQSNSWWGMVPKRMKLARLSKMRRSSRLWQSLSTTQ